MKGELLIGGLTILDENLCQLLSLIKILVVTHLPTNCHKSCFALDRLASFTIKFVDWERRFAKLFWKVLSEILKQSNRTYLVFGSFLFWDLGTKRFSYTVKDIITWELDFKPSPNTRSPGYKPFSYQYIYFPNYKLLPLNIISKFRPTKPRNVLKPWAYTWDCMLF